MIEPMSGNMVGRGLPRCHVCARRSNKLLVHKAHRRLIAPSEGGQRAGSINGNSHLSAVRADLRQQPSAIRLVTCAETNDVARCRDRTSMTSERGERVAHDWKDVREGQFGVGEGLPIDDAERSGMEQHVEARSHVAVDEDRWHIVK
ncbi:MAG: hypothetical protein QOG69_338, partial [Actinomycetota bacterium]|nr:hypothetical protein [Actinomycetota bacterium]